VTELLVILVVCAIAYRIAFPTQKATAFVSQAASQPQAPISPPVPAAPASNTLQSLRKRLAADEKLTPELKSAFDLIQAALEEK
jgi:hypothetical protein